MGKRIAFRLGAGYLSRSSEASGRIVRTWKDEQRILWTYVPELPAQDARHGMPWLTVLRWEYDGSGSEGMPTAEENQHMLMLDADIGKVERPDFCHEAYRRIGAGVREFVFYIVDCGKFIEEFNNCAVKDPRYPITIKFYMDEEWSELRDLIDDFKATALNILRRGRATLAVGIPVL